MTLASVVSSVAGALNIKAQGSDGQLSTSTIVLLAAVLLCVTAPFETSQIIFALVGAVTYSIVQASHYRIRQQKQKQGDSGKSAKAPRSGSQAAHTENALRRFRGHGGHVRPAADRTRAPKEPREVQPRAEYRKPSSHPVAAPTFQASGWEEEVQELLTQISPSAEGDKVVQLLARTVKQSISQMIPEAEVTGFASGDLVRGTAFGVAVPEVDIVVSVDPKVLVARLNGRLTMGGMTTAKLDARKLQKSAIRACTDRLVSQGGFKFRRSAFRGQDPKVTLLAPTTLGLYSEAIPIDFSVNSVTPLYNAALLTECGQMEPRAKELILLVKRWAKDRGVCHAAKGHLSPYAWSLASMYFLQVGGAREGSLLPPLSGFDVSSGLAAKAMPAEKALGEKTKPWSPPQGVEKDGVGELFKQFARFFNTAFDWRNEAISVRMGKRASPHLHLPLHIIVSEDGASTTVAPSIEDPFEPTRNLGSCMTEISLERLREELVRADEICSRDGSLTELLEPWVPPERKAPGSGDGGKPGGEDEEASET